MVPLHCPRRAGRVGAVALAVEAEMTPEDAEKLQRAYLRKRRAWGRKIGRPYSDDIENPDPGELELADPEEG